LPEPFVKKRAFTEAAGPTPLKYRPAASTPSTVQSAPEGTVKSSASSLS